MSERQYLTAKFSTADKRAYTYHNDGPRVRRGDQVTVPGRGDSSRVVTVEEDAVAKPPFETKGIIGKALPGRPGRLL